MANGRMFVATFEDVAVTAIQDLFYLKASATVPVWVHQVVLSQRTLTAWEAKPVRIRYVPATVTQSTGTAVTPSGVDVGGKAAAAASTVVANATTLATSSGTIIDLYAEQWAFLNGLIWIPPDPQDRIFIKPGDAIVVRLEVAPSGSMNVSGTLQFEEVG
jgi:hypothetical protein